MGDRRRTANQNIGSAIEAIDDRVVRLERQIREERAARQAVATSLTASQATIAALEARIAVLEAV